MSIHLQAMIGIRVISTGTVVSLSVRAAASFGL